MYLFCDGNVERSPLRCQRCPHHTTATLAQSVPVFPGAGYMEVAAATATCMLSSGGDSMGVVHAASFIAPLSLQGLSGSLQCLVNVGSSMSRLEIRSTREHQASSSGYTLHVAANYTSASLQEKHMGPEVNASTSTPSAVILKSRGPPAVRSGTAALKASQPSCCNFLTNPAMVDCSLQLSAITMQGSSGSLIPVGFGAYAFSSLKGPELLTSVSNKVLDSNLAIVRSQHGLADPFAPTTGIALVDVSARSVTGFGTVMSRSAGSRTTGQATMPVFPLLSTAWIVDRADPWQSASAGRDHSPAVSLNCASHQHAILLMQYRKSGAAMSWLVQSANRPLCLECGQAKCKEELGITGLIRTATMEDPTFASSLSMTSHLNPSARPSPAQLSLGSPPATGSH
eukprot:scaffold23888_cov49-Prasinocladus_malaysianus.AAC.2